MAASKTFTNMNTALIPGQGKERLRDDWTTMRPLQILCCKPSFDGLAWSAGLTDLEASAHPRTGKEEHHRFTKRNGTML